MQFPDAAQLLSSLASPARALAAGVRIVFPHTVVVPRFLFPTSFVATTALMFSPFFLDLLKVPCIVLAFFGTLSISLKCVTCLLILWCHWNRRDR